MNRQRVHKTNKRNGRCKNCPGERSAKKSQSSLNGAKVDAKLVSVEGEAKRLWNHVIYGAGTCIGMIAGYAQLGLPGDPAPQLKALVNRLLETIQSLETQRASSIAEGDKRSNQSISGERVIYSSPHDHSPVSGGN